MLVKADRIRIRPKVGLPAVYLGDLAERRFKTLNGTEKQG